MSGFDFLYGPILWHARDGHLKPLAQHIEDGGNLDADLRKFLVDYLRGRVKFGRGNRRTFAQIDLEAGVTSTVRFIQSTYGLSRYAAMKRYLAADLSMNPETLKTYMRKADRPRQLRRAARVSK